MPSEQLHSPIMTNHIPMHISIVAQAIPSLQAEEFEGVRSISGGNLVITRPQRWIFISEKRYSSGVSLKFILHLREVKRLGRSIRWKH
jgi:hypothetical protein